MRNDTVTTFILLGLTDDPQLQVLLFVFLLLTYMLSVTGNLTIITLTFVDSHLKTPIYFFLQNFSFLEVSFTSACIPRFLYNIATGDKGITYNSCVIQAFLTDLFAVSEIFLFAAMSYDRCVAICKSLQYMTIKSKSKSVCNFLIICCWTDGLYIIIPPLKMFLKLEFFDSNIIDHVACDAFPLVKIACSDRWLLEETVTICAMLTLNMTLTCVVLSYVYIIRTIFRFSSVQQRKKAFSTCSYHMIMVSINYGRCISIYINPTAMEEVTTNKVVILLISSISPTLNPFIYTLRNNQVMKTFKDSIKRIEMLSTKYQK